MKLLVFGDSNSIWVKEYIEYVLLSEAFDISIICNNGKGKYFDFYKKNNIKMITIGLVEKNRISYMVNRVVKYITIIRAVDRYDIIHVHYLDKFKGRAIKFFRKRATLIVGSFWGTDLLDEAQRMKRENYDFLGYYDKVTVSTTYLKEQFKLQFPNYDCQKLFLVKFGVSRFDSIRELQGRYSKPDVKKELGILPEKWVITIGYNGSLGQQHLKVVEALKGLSKGVREKSVFVLPVTYPADLNLKHYFDEVEMVLKKLELNYIVVEKYLTDVEVARLRYASDIFIHAQITDAFSASVQEYLYAGSILINPKWIKYGELKKSGIKYYEYSEFNEIPEIIENIFLGSKVNNQEVKDLLWEMSSWQAVKKNWLKLYEMS